MCGSVVDIQSATAVIRRKKEEEERRNHRMKILCSHLLRRVAITSAQQLLRWATVWPQ